MKLCNVIVACLFSAATLSAATDSLGFVLPLGFKGLPEPMMPCSPSLITSLTTDTAGLRLDEEDSDTEVETVAFPRLRAGDVVPCAVREADARHAADNDNVVMLLSLARNTSFDAPVEGDGFGWTCGMYAARSNALKALDFLFTKDEKGRRYAKPLLLDERNKTALMIAASNSGCAPAVKKIAELCPETIDYYYDDDGSDDEDNESQMTALKYAIRANQVGAMGALINQGASLTVGYPLHYAVKLNSVLAVQIILKKDASVKVIDLRDTEGKTPLMLAVDLGHTRIFDILREHHANPFVRDCDDYTAWSYSKEGSDDDAIMIAYQGEYSAWKREQNQCPACHAPKKRCGCA